MIDELDELKHFNKQLGVQYNMAYDHDLYDLLHVEIPDRHRKSGQQIKQSNEND